jgi:hypothetical protein
MNDFKEVIHDFVTEQNYPKLVLVFRGISHAMMKNLELAFFFTRGSENISNMFTNTLRIKVGIQNLNGLFGCSQGEPFE